MQTALSLTAALLSKQMMFILLLRMAANTHIRTTGRQERIMPHGESPQIYPPTHIGNGLFVTLEKNLENHYQNKFTNRGPIPGALNYLK